MHAFNAFLLITFACSKIWLLCWCPMTLLIKITEHKAKSMLKRQARSIRDYLTAQRASQEFNPFLSKMLFQLCKAHVQRLAA